MSKKIVFMVKAEFVGITPGLKLPKKEVRVFRTLARNERKLRKKIITTCRKHGYRDSINIIEINRL